jgi:hypothetical protein
LPKTNPHRSKNPATIQKNGLVVPVISSSFAVDRAEQF